MDYSVMLHHWLAQFPPPFNLLVIWITLLEMTVITLMVVTRYVSHGAEAFNGSPDARKWVLTVLIASAPLQVLMIASIVWQFVLSPR